MIIEYNAATGETTQREMTAEEIAAMQVETTPIIPQEITSRQLRIQLVLNGFDLSQVDSIIDTLPEPHKSIAKVSWEYAGTFERNNPLLLQVAQALGMSEETLDEIFINAQNL